MSQKPSYSETKMSRLSISVMASNMTTILLGSYINCSDKRNKLADVAEILPSRSSFRWDWASGSTFGLFLLFLLAYLSSTFKFWKILSDVHNTEVPVVPYWVPGLFAR